MKKSLFILLLFFCHLLATAQNADQTVGQLVNSQNWLELNKQYPQLKSQMKSEVLKNIAEAMIGYQFNQPEQTMQAINILLNKHQTELGTQNTYNFIILLAKTLCQQGQYASAASMMNNILPALSSQPREGLVGALFTFNKEIQALKNQQPIKIIPLSHDITIPCNNMWNITANINNKPLAFAIDPRSEHTVIPIETAKALNLKILPDTVEHMRQKVLLGIVEKMNIGELEVHNIVAEIPLTSDKPLTIGRDILSAIGEIQLDIDNSKIIFPKDYTTAPLTGPTFYWDMKFNITPNHHKMAINYKDMFIMEIGKNKDSTLSYEKQLDEVKVMAARKLVKVGSGKLTYDVSNDEEAKASSVFEILRKVPLITIDGQDNILVKGNSSYKIYRNGHLDPTLSGMSAKDILKAIPASTIRQIEVITEPGAKYDAEGTSAVLNIITSSNSLLKGSTGMLSSSVNNNGTNRSSAYAATSLGKTTLSANYAFTQYPTKESESSIHSSVSYRNGQVLDMQRQSQSRGNAHYMNIAASCDIDSLNLLSLSAGGYFLSYKTNSMSNYSRYYNLNDLLYSYDENNLNPRNRYSTYNLRMDYQHKTRKPGNVFTLSYMLNGTQNKIDNNIVYTNFFNMPMDYTAYNRHVKNNNTEHTIQFDYTKSIDKHNTVDFGLKYIYRLSKNTTEQNYSGKETSISSFFNHSTNIAATYLEWNTQYGKWNFRPGLRYEFSRLKGFYPKGNGDTYSCNLNDFVPSVNILYKLNDVNTIQYNYAMSINRPGINYLNPAVIIQPESKTYGSTNLKSSRSSQMAITWTNITGKTTNQMILAYGFTNNFLTNVDYVADNVRTTTYANALHVRMASFMDFLQWTPTPKTRISINSTLGWMKDYYPEQGIYNKGLYGNVSGNISQKLFWNLLLNVGGGASFGHNLSGLYGRAANYHSDYLSLQRSFLKDDKLTISLWAVCPFENHKAQTQYTTQGEYTGFTHTVNVSRQFGVRLSLKLGNNKIEVKKPAKNLDNKDIVGGLKAPKE